VNDLHSKNFGKNPLTDIFFAVKFIACFWTFDVDY